MAGKDKNSSLKSLRTRGENHSTDRSREARRRFRRKAAEFSVIPSVISETGKHVNASWTIYALIGGFMIGASPTFRRNVLRGATHTLSALASMR
jgi:hypothetical protein